MNEITMNQATKMMDTICEKIYVMIERTYFTDGEITTPEVEEITRECFCEICDILGIEEVLEN